MVLFERRVPLEIAQSYGPDDSTTGGMHIDYEAGSSGLGADGRSTLSARSFDDDVDRRGDEQQAHCRE